MGAVESIDEADVRHQSAKSIREMADVLCRQGTSVFNIASITVMQAGSAPRIHE